MGVMTDQETAASLFDEVQRLHTVNAQLAQSLQGEGIRRPSTAPQVCPITGRQFFMVIDHPVHGLVPTYGGPYDSFTLPERDEDGFSCERYDHDDGAWVDGCESVSVRLIDDQRDDCEHGEVARLEQQRDELQQRCREHEQFRHQHRDCDQMGIDLHQARRQRDELLHEVERLRARLAIIGAAQAVAALEQPAAPVAWQERQARRIRKDGSYDWSGWYACADRAPDAPLSVTTGGIPYEWRPLYAAPVAGATGATTQQSWIPVSERPPEPGRQVLAMGADLFAGCQIVVRLILDAGDARAWLVDTGAGLVEVQQPSHWMPLPTPPATPHTESDPA